MNYELLADPRVDKFFHIGSMDPYVFLSMLAISFALVCVTGWVLWRSERGKQ
jgi:hypothetical protein